MLQHYNIKNEETVYTKCSLQPMCRSPKMYFTNVYEGKYLPVAFELIDIFILSVIFVNG